MKKFCSNENCWEYVDEIYPDSYKHETYDCFICHKMIKEMVVFKSNGEIFVAECFV